MLLALAIRKRGGNDVAWGDSPAVDGDGVDGFGMATQLDESRPAEVGFGSNLSLYDGSNSSN